jgi:hypothetical protein
MLRKLVIILVFAAGGLTGGIPAAQARQSGPVFSNYGQCHSALVRAQRHDPALDTAFCRSVEGGYTYAEEIVDDCPPPNIPVMCDQYGTCEGCVEPA